MNSEQFAEAYARTFAPMVRAFIGRGLRYDRAEDLVQSAFLRGFERLGQLKDDESVAGWVGAMALNKLRDDARSRWRMRQFEPEDNMAAPPEVDFAAIDAAISAERILQLCDDERQRTMCLCVYIHETPTSVVAQNMGISRQALISRLARTRRVVRKKLKARHFGMGTPLKRG